MNYLPIKLEKLRKHYNYSQSYLAEVLGVDVIDYMGYENGRKMIDYNQAKRLASLYHIDLIEIFKNDDNVTLYNVDEGKTDEINIEFFIPKKTIFTRIKEHPIISVLIISLSIVVVILASLITKSNNRQLVIYSDNTDRLACSNTSLIYIDNLGAVKGAGDNSNSQISNLVSENALKVQEGSDFSITLLNDGTIVSSGLLENYQKELSKLDNIIDIATGDNHIIALDKNGKVYAIGDNTYGQCDLDDFKKVKAIFAKKNATIGVSEEGEIYIAGTLTGTSKLNKQSNIKDIDLTNENLIILKEDGTCEYVASHNNSQYQKIDTWTNVVDVACGNEFFAALQEDGTVLMASINLDETTITSLTNVIAISAADEYLVCFDGNEIKGVGKNTYHQFEDNKNYNTLSSVNNISIDYNNNEVFVSFSSVENASGYKVILDLGDGSGLVKEVDDNNTVIFTTDSLQDNNMYTVSVQAIGSGIYESSLVAKKEFVYLIQIEEDEEETITVSNKLIGMSKEEFDEYANSIGISDYAEVESNDECSGETKQVVSLNGIKEGSTYTISELRSRYITVAYCKIKVEENHEQ